MQVSLFGDPWRYIQAVITPNLRRQVQRARGRSLAEEEILGVVAPLQPSVRLFREGYQCSREIQDCHAHALPTGIREGL